MEYTYNVLKIAKLMGIMPIKAFNEYSGKEYYCYNNTEMKSFETLPFYNTWNEIMPIVIKIESLGGDENKINIFGNCVKIGTEEFIAETKLSALIKAINWWISQRE